MRARALFIPFAVAAVAVAGCLGGGGGSDPADDINAALDVFFPPEHADALAHAAMPGPEDLPGPGWEVVARDEFDGDEEDDAFDRAAENEPACAPLRELEALGGIFGDDDADDPPVGRAQIEFANARSRGVIPSGVEVSVEMARTVAEIQAGWAVMKGMLESGQLQDCMVAALNGGFGELAAGRGSVEVSGRDVSARTPNEGAGMAVDLHMEVAGVDANLAFEMHFWRYGNAAVTVFIVGTPGEVNLGLTGPVLGAVTDKLEAAAAIAAAGEDEAEAEADAAP
jgi:hypothetical protein